MTLTEEQREAIRVISKLPMAIGCQLCHPYIMENYGSHFIVLRDMIDSSDQFSEVTKLIPGFDLERIKADLGEIGDPRFCDCEVRTQLAAAIAEIERLQNWKDIAENRGAIIRRQITIIRNRGTLAEEQAAEIERLRGYEIAARDLSADLTKVAGARDEQAARIEELEAQLTIANVALENATRKPNVVYITGTGELGPDADAKPREGLYGKYRISKADGSPVDPNADYFVLRLDTDPVARRAAREYSYMTVDRKLASDLQERITKYNPKMMDCINLQFFGVEKPRVWQITEERKAAIKTLLVEMNDVPTSIHDIDLVIHAENVLRAMLEEAE